MKKALLLAAALCFGCAGGAIAQDYSIIHSFAGGPGNGADPDGGLLRVGNGFYGVTADGGANDMGMIFAVNESGGVFAPVYHFGAIPNDGDEPSGGLISDGSTLYGVTSYGGLYGPGGGGSYYGTIFRIDLNGSNYWVPHDFEGGAADGKYPVGPLVLISGKLYGVAQSGGTSSHGVIFSVNTNGLNYQILHNFAGGPDDGEDPARGLLRDGNTLYGVTRRGGEYIFYGGTVYSIKTDGSGFTLLHSFSGADGLRPSGPLVSDGSRLYGTCPLGGSSIGIGYYGGYGGTAFSLNRDGSGFSVLHNFEGGDSDGSGPQGALTLDGDTIYGTTVLGGGSPLGTGVIYSMGRSGSNFEVIYTCDGLIEGDGSMPLGSMIFDDGTLYGMMRTGGSSGNGVIFSFVPPPPSNYVNLTASPTNVAPGGAVTMGWSCDFSDWNYRNVPVNIYLLAIKSPRVEDGPSSTADALAGGQVFSFGPGMASVHPGAPTQPTWSNVAFPPAPTSGSRAVSIPSNTSLAGDWVFAAAFVRTDTGAFVRTDGKPVENSNVFSIR